MIFLIIEKEILIFISIKDNYGFNNFKKNRVRKDVKKEDFFINIFPF
jgi:hypothetical protein